jgi:hypothetical protein
MANVTTYRGNVSSKQLRNICVALIGFRQTVNLISFNLAEVFVIQGNLDLQVKSYE